MTFDSILKTYDKGQYTKITVDNQCECGFVLSPESTTAINKIQMTHHCPEIIIRILSVSKLGGIYRFPENDFKVPTAPRIIITGDSIPKTKKQNREYDKPFALIYLGSSEVDSVRMTIESDKKIATEAFEEIIKCIIRDCVATKVIAANEEDAATDTSIALSKRIEYLPKGTTFNVE